jgi:hypothetical protein
MTTTLYNFRRLNRFVRIKNQKLRFFSKRSLLKITPGNDLLSQPVTRQVPSAQRGLTAVFGMGTGGSPSPLSPGIFEYNL